MIWGRGRGWLVTLGALLLAASGCAIDSQPKDTPALTSGSVRVTYADPAGSPSAAAIRDSHLADDIAEAVNTALRLPRPLTIAMGAGSDGPAWRPASRTIELPWAFVADVEQTLQRAGYGPDRLADGVVHVVAFVLTHELAHALADELQLPLVGNEEDAADSFATVVAVSLLRNGALVEAAGDYFAAHDRGATREAAEYAAAHSLDIQRFHTINCLVYGSDPAANASFATRSGLSDARLAQCPSQWQNTSAGWATLVKPHLRATD